MARKIRRSSFKKSLFASAQSIVHAIQTTVGGLVLMGAALLVVTLILQAVVSTDVARAVVLLSTSDFLSSIKASLNHLFARPIELLPLVFQLVVVSSATVLILKQLGFCSRRVEQSDKGAEFLREQLRIITDGTDQGIFLASLNGVVRYLNPCLAENGRRAVGGKWFELLNCASEVEAADLWSSVTTELRTISFPCNLQSPERSGVCKLVPVVRLGTLYGVVGFVKSEVPIIPTVEQTLSVHAINRSAYTDEQVRELQTSIAALREEAAARDRLLRDELDTAIRLFKAQSKQAQSLLEKPFRKPKRLRARRRAQGSHIDHGIVLEMLRLEQRVDRLAKRHDRRISILIESLSTLVSASLKSSETKIIEDQDLDPLNRLVKLHRSAEHRPKNRHR